MGALSSRDSRVAAAVEPRVTAAQPRASSRCGQDSVTSAFGWADKRNQIREKGSSRKTMALCQLSELFGLPATLRAGRTHAGQFPS